MDSDLIVLAGGSARRLGGIDKAMVAMPDGRAVLAHVLCAPVTGRRVVVGPERTVADSPAGLRWTREQPPGGGPVAGIAAGMRELHPPAAVTVVLAADMPFAADAVPALLAALDGAGPATDVGVVTTHGRRQPLLAAWRSPALLAALARCDPPAGVAMRQLLAGGTVVEIADPAQWSRDIDTPQDLAAMTAPETPAPQDPLGAWVQEAATELGLDVAAVDVDVLLDLARDAAHGVARPAAPLTTFLAGLAAGRAGGDVATVRAAAATLTELLSARHQPDV